MGRMPSRVLVHLPPPEPPQLVDRPPRRPARGDEFPRAGPSPTISSSEASSPATSTRTRCGSSRCSTGRRPGQAPPAPGENGAPASTDRRKVLSPPCRPCMAIAHRRGRRPARRGADRRRHPRVARSGGRDPLGRGDGGPVDDLEPELCRAILDVLDRATHRPPTRCASALARAALPPHRGRASSGRSTTPGGEHAAAWTTAGASERSGDAHPLVRPAKSPQLRLAVLEADPARDGLRQAVGCWGPPAGCRSLGSNTPTGGILEPTASTDKEAMSPWLVRFPHTHEPVVVMDFSGREPRPGQEVITGWRIDRGAAPGPEAEGQSSAKSGSSRSRHSRDSSRRDPDPHTRCRARSPANRRGERSVR